MSKSAAPTSSPPTAGDTSYTSDKQLKRLSRRGHAFCTFNRYCFSEKQSGKHSRSPVSSYIKLLCYRLTTHSLLRLLLLVLCCAVCSKVINEGLFSLSGWVTGSGVMRYGGKDRNKEEWSFAWASIDHFHIEWSFVYWANCAFEMLLIGIWPWKSLCVESQWDFFYLRYYLVQ